MQNSLTSSIIVSKFQYLGFDVEISKLQYKISTDKFVAMQGLYAKILHNGKPFIIDTYLSDRLEYAEKNAKFFIADLCKCETVDDITKYISDYLIEWNNSHLLKNSTAFAINYFYNKISNK